jgi:5'-phosphate synthase pdxT subunit
VTRIGVLALQGGYAAHGKALAECGFEAVEVRTAADLASVAGLVLPGGESTTHLKLIDRFGLAAPLDAFVRAGNPVLATCAGLILAAQHVSDPAQPSFAWIDVDVARNAWGRQVHSFEAEATGAGVLAGAEPLPLIFIRAPRITRVGEGVEVLATLDGEPIMVRQGNVIGAAYHPELTADRRVHRLAFGSESGA